MNTSERMKTPRISIIVPVLNEAQALSKTLARLPAAVEIIVVDGGSTDDTLKIVAANSHQLVQSDRGRAKQMNAGAAVAQGEILVFLHADTLLPADFEQVLALFYGSNKKWGRFDVCLDAPGFIYRIIETMMNQRSRLTGICTGDQAIFVRRQTFEQIGGFVENPLMEDIEISKRLKKISPLYRVRQPVITSARRWQQKGVLQTILLMWRLRFLYLLGVSPTTLVKQYYR